MEAETFPIEDIEASVADRRLQKRYRFERLSEEERTYLDAARAEAIEAGAPPSARWIYFRSPQWTWERECGREGWLLYDAESRAQYAFLWTVMS